MKDKELSNGYNDEELDECGCGSGDCDCNDDCDCDDDCGCGHDHHHHDHEEIESIHLILDDGTELDCLVLATIEVNGKDYIALLPEDDETVLIYEYSDTDEGPVLKNIDSEEEFKQASKAFEEIFEEYDNLDDDDFEEE